MTLPETSSARAVTRGLWVIAFALLALEGRAAEPAAAPLHAGASSDSVIPLAAWNDPPQAVRPIARWWWPGGSVDETAMREQLRRIRDAGFGAVELQPLLLGLGDEDLQADPRLRSVGTASFQESVALAAALASEAGLEFAFTLSSGWPGGLPTESRNAERQLLMTHFDLDGPATTDAELPPAPDQSYRRAVEWILDVLGPPDPDVHLVAVLASQLQGERRDVPRLDTMQVITDSVRDGRLLWQAPPGVWRIFVFYENSTHHFVMGGAFSGAETDALVVDHLSQRGADALLEEFAAPSLSKVAPGQLSEVFVDSFELMGELPFSSELLAAFETQAGYPLTPHLPLLFRKGGESKYAEMMDIFGRSGGPLYLSSVPGRAERIREDYEAVRASLFERRFVDRIAEWTHQRGLRLRLQAHGGYANYLDLYARADVPESEALFGGGSFDFLKLASSAAHVAGKRWSSSESFITLRLFGRTLARDEMRLLAGRAYAAGINKLAFHGVPYPYRRADGKAWYPFSGGFGRILAGPLPMSSRIDAEFLETLPDFNRLLARLSVAMSAGEPVADLAWLRAEPTYPDTASLQLGRVEARAGESSEADALRASGLVHDRVSRRMLRGAWLSGDRVVVGAQRYSALLLDPFEVAEPELVERLASFAEAGIPIIALGSLPHRAPGLRDAEVRDGRVRHATTRLSKHILRRDSSTSLEELLQEQVASDLIEAPNGERLEVSIDRRRSAGGETLLVFNESWKPREARLRFRRGGGRLTLWNPADGSRKLLRTRLEAGETIALKLAAAETVLLTLQTESGTPPTETSNPKTVVP